MTELPPRPKISPRAIISVNAKGELSGAFAFGGPGEQANRLMADGIEVISGKVDLKKYAVEIIDGEITNG